MFLNLLNRNLPFIFLGQERIFQQKSLTQRMWRLEGTLKGICARKTIVGDMERPIDSVESLYRQEKPPLLALEAAIWSAMTELPPPAVFRSTACVMNPQQAQHPKIPSYLNWMTFSTPSSRVNNRSIKRGCPNLISIIIFVIRFFQAIRLNSLISPSAHQTFICKY